MQNIVHRYHGLDTARQHNRRFVEIVRAGVYAGFKLRVNAAYPDRLDIVKGSSARSVLVTSEGVIVEETEDLINAVRVDPADSIRERIDLVVCEYQFTTDPGVKAVYKVIKGRNQSDLNTDPVAPGLANAYQVALGTVRVRAQQAVGGTAWVRLEQTDVVFAPEAELTAPEDMAALKPEVDFVNTKRIFVYPGIFPNATHSLLIRWTGGYSEEINDLTMSEGEIRYFLYAISDDNKVNVVASSSDPDTIGGYSADVLPIAIARVEKSGGIGRIVSLTDVRFPFSRQLTPRIEEDAYREELLTSVFQYARIDVLETSDLIDLGSARGPTGYETLLRTYIDRSDTSLTFQWLSSTNPDADVEIVTEDLLYGTPISLLTHFLVSFDTTAQGVTFEYSSVSKSTGFTNQRFTPNKIITLTGGGGGRLFIKFRIPKDAFTISSIQKIYSYAVMLNLDPDTLNSKVIAELGIGNLLQNQVNLIANGDFRWWSRNDADGEQPDCDGPQEISYAISADPASIDAGTEIFAADGWQFTRIEYEGDTKSIKRVIYSNDVLMSAIENAIDTALFWSGAAGDQGKVNHLEYRVPVTAEMRGQKVTFAFDFSANAREAVGIGVAMYSRDESGNFTLLSRVEAGAIAPSGTLLLESDIAIAEDTYAVGFYIIFQQLTSTSEVYVRNARAVVGSFKNLPQMRVSRPKDELRPYYERGRIVSTGQGLEGDLVLASMQFGGVKHLGLSKDKTVVAKTIANRAQNVDSITMTANDQGIVVTGRVIVSGHVALDIDWEAFILYPRVS